MYKIVAVILFLLACSFVNVHSTRSDYSAKGKASYYGVGFHGRKTANGEIYNKYLFTAAHKKLPFNSYVRVTNLKNNLSITVRINDRGPFHGARIIDLSEAAARRIGSYHHGLTTVQVESVNYLRLTPEIDSLFTTNEVLDCLGNLDELDDYSLSLYRTNDLLHMIYLSNELYLHEDVEKIYIVGRGQGKKRVYHLVVSNIENREEQLKSKDYYERKGFMDVRLFE